MNRKKIISQLSTKVSHSLSQFVRSWFVFLAIVICLTTFPAWADEAPDTENKENEVVKETEESPETQVESTEKSKSDTSSSDSDEKPTKVKTEIIVGSSDEMDGDEKKGITILIGNAKTVRLNEAGVEIGFLNADKITLKRDPETRQTKEIIAEGNVEIRDQDIFATCEHATMNNLTNIIILKEKVVVLQNKDRLETKIFTYNRTTGKQTGVGGVKFKVTVTQAVPEESEETSSNSEDTPESEEQNIAPKSEEKTEGKSESAPKEEVSEEENTPAESEEEEKDSEPDTDEEEEKDSEPDTDEEEEKDSEPDTDEETEPEETE